MYTKKNKIRITQSLISSYDWSFKTEDGWDNFLKALNREKTPPTVEMLKGTQYENVLNNVLNGEEISPDHEWYKPICQMSEILKGSQQQVSLFREVEVDGQTYLVHGVLDFLKAGHIYDCKYSERYGSRNNIVKYINSAQSIFYMYLVPEAFDMTYLISDGKFVYSERYDRDMVDPIEPTIRQFVNFLKHHDLYKIFEEKWKVQN